MFEVTFDNFTILCDPEALPSIYHEYRKRSALSEEFELEKGESNSWCFVGVSSGGSWPLLTVAQRYWAGGGFNPGVLLVPETSTLFIGVGERLLAYKLGEPKQLWMDFTMGGFWYWRRYGDVVLMAAELELAAWSIEGVRLWSVCVEPPWTYEVDGEFLTVDVMGKKTEFSLCNGPKTSR